MSTEPSMERDFERVRSILDGTRGEAGVSTREDAYAAVLLGALHGEDADAVQQWAESHDVADGSEVSAATEELQGLALVDVDNDDEALRLDEVSADEPHHVADVVAMLS